MQRCGCEARRRDASSSNESLGESETSGEWGQNLPFSSAGNWGGIWGYWEDSSGCCRVLFRCSLSILCSLECWYYFWVGSYSLWPRCCSVFFDLLTCIWVSICVILCGRGHLLDELTQLLQGSAVQSFCIMRHIKAKVPFVEGLLPLRPYLQSFRSAVSCIQSQVLSKVYRVILKFQKKCYILYYTTLLIKSTSLGIDYECVSASYL